MKAWLQLLRLPALFTALPDIILGYVLAKGVLSPTPDVAILLVCSACLYLSGMVLNDLFDFKQDLEERPERPLPAGKISLQNAAICGALLMLCGIGAAQVVSEQSLFVAVGLAMCILIYDRWAKRTVWGPLFMGGCRFGNILLGASLATPLWTNRILWVAAGFALYILGLTWFARTEAKQSSRHQLTAAMIAINLGFMVLIAFMAFHPGKVELTSAMIAFALTVLVVNRRLANALFDPIPIKIQLSVRTMLYSYVILSALLVLYLTGNIAYAVGVLCLLLPSMFLGRWLSIT